ncbi:MAG: hypothetical protein U5M51_02390 [Emticicia sp.]|nr:hypothetical protein [Emticicia sp.]
MKNRTTSSDEQIAKLDKTYELVKNMPPNDLIELSVLAITGNYEEDHVIEQFSYLIEREIFKNSEFSVSKFITELCKIAPVELGFSSITLSIILDTDKLYSLLLNIDFDKIINKNILINTLKLCEDSSKYVIERNKSPESVENNKKQLMKIEYLYKLLMD